MGEHVIARERVGGGYNICKFSYPASEARTTEAEAQKTSGDTTVSACCDGASGQKGPTWVRGIRGVFAWVVPSALLALMPKCPVCVAGYVALWTGLGLSLSAAAYLRSAMIVVCIAALLLLIGKQFFRGANIRHE